MKTLVKIIALSLFLNGCAGIARTDSAKSIKYQDIKSAAIQTKSIGEIKSNDFKNIKISENSPLIEMENLKGRYEIVKISGEKNKPFDIMTVPICDCLGFRKWIIDPHTFLMDDRGQILASGNIIRGKFSESGDFFILIVANDLNNEKIVGKTVDPGTTYKNQVSAPIKIHPTGIVQIKFNRP